MTQTSPPDFKFVLPLFSEKADLQTAGGKGMNLARLMRAGFDVPRGFLITTPAYRLYVASNQLEQRILALLPDGPVPTDVLEDASGQIRTLFWTGKIPVDLAEEITSAYLEHGPKPVAVRSSATAEDLPGMSFAGQQDTFLNVSGREQLLGAVIDCWSSLWTARAIGYRSRNGVSHETAALAVVVQEMVDSKVSGVMFTANPLSGLRTETVIDAVFGLGESLVSGRVEPDQYIVEPSRPRITVKKLGQKELSIHAETTGGARETVQGRAGLQALDDEQILCLAAIGQKVQELYGFPQDIEWALADGRFSLLQSRPITSLYPIPQNMPNGLQVLFSFGAVQGLFDPITPIGQDSLRWLVAMAHRMIGIKKTPETQRILYSAGQRLWVNISPILRNKLGRKIAPAVLGMVEPTVRQAVLQILDEPDLQPGHRSFSLKGRLQLGRLILPLAANIILNLISPQNRRRHIVGWGERMLADLETRSRAIGGDMHQKLLARAQLLPELTTSRLVPTFRLFVSGVAAGMAAWNLLNRVSGAGTDSSSPARAARDLVMQVTRGMPHNPTTEMDLDLWRMAKSLRSDPASMKLFQENTSDRLSDCYLKRQLPEAVLQAVDPFLARYGARGLGEIDLGRARWGENPTHVFEMLGSFMRIENEEMAPDVVFARSAQSAQQAVERLAETARQQHGGWIKARLVRFLAGRARRLMGIRENPKFFAVRMMWIIQRELLKSGQEYVQAGVLERPDDVFYLTFSELSALANAEKRAWGGLIAQRRESCRYEMLRRQIPRLLLSDGRAFYAGLAPAGNAENVINGSPVSPGMVEGNVRVVLDPRQAHLLPGEILVCPGTDPSWTPLFLSAGGLVMETGGLMTHGAVVAREYGIPAIVGVDRATQRLETGQRIRMDGSSGLIEFVNSG